jgi:hypothetical protein
MAKGKYFDLEEDLHIPGRWHLESPVDAAGRLVNPWQFREGRRLHVEGELLLPLERPGSPLDFSMTGLAIPIVSGRAASLLERIGLQEEIQLIPARVPGHPEPYFILNALKVIRCIDDARCEEVLYWRPEDERPEKTGQYRNVVGMKLDAASVGAAHIFRPWGWRVALICSERVKLALERAGMTGPRFVEV